MNAIQYVAALRTGLKEALGVIEGLDSMTPQSPEFGSRSLKTLA